MELFKKTIDGIGNINEKAMEDAQVRLDNLLKPQGSLGKLEYIAKKLAGITGKINNHINKKAIVVMAADNGVYAENVASFPKEVSVLVANTMVTGLSGVAVLAKHAGSDLIIVDIGLDTDQKINGMINKKIRKGTGNIAKGPAMTKEEVIMAIEIGIEITNNAIEEGANLIGTGEVGIANTTTSSAVLYSITKGNIDDIVGRGAGLDDEGLKRKKEVVLKSVKINNPDQGDPIDILSKVGGFDIAGLVGCYLACANKRVPVVIDGFISGIAAILAGMIKKESKEFMLPSHITDEPGGKLINQILGFEPFLKMNMRLGEGTGCAIAFTIIEAAVKMMNNMGTFKDIGM